MKNFQKLYITYKFYKMKQIIRKISIGAVVLILTTTLISLKAQNKDQQRNIEQNKGRIEAQKVAFITTRLDLSSAEAEKFWPVFNEYKNEQKAKQKAWRNEHDFEPGDIDKMTDAEAEEFARDQLNHEQEMLDLRKGLITNMKDIISPQKILMLLEAEKEFRMELMKRVSQGRGTGVGRSEDRR